MFSECVKLMIYTLNDSYSNFSFLYFFCLLQLCVKNEHEKMSTVQIFCQMRVFKAFSP